MKACRLRYGLLAVFALGITNPVPGADQPPEKPGFSASGEGRS